MSISNPASVRLSEIQERLDAQRHTWSADFRTWADANFIAHAPSDIASLLTLTRALRDALEPFVAIGNVADWSEEKVGSSRPDNATAALCVSVGAIRRARALLEQIQE